MEAQEVAMQNRQTQFFFENSQALHLVVNIVANGIILEYNQDELCSSSL
jgi:hypothetical protein